MWSISSASLRLTSSLLARSTSPPVCSAYLYTSPGGTLCRCAEKSGFFVYNTVANFDKRLRSNKPHTTLPLRQEAALQQTPPHTARFKQLVERILLRMQLPRRDAPPMLGPHVFRRHVRHVIRQPDDHLPARRIVRLRRARRSLIDAFVEERRLVAPHLARALNRGDDQLPVGREVLQQLRRRGVGRD